MSGGGRFELGGRSLREHTARGVLINSGFQAGIAVVGLLQRTAVAAFLTASAFGLFGLVITTIMPLAALGGIGVQNKYVQQDEPDQEAAFQKAFTIYAGWTLIVWLAILCLLPLYALVIFDRPDVLAPGLVFSLVVPISALTMPISIAFRRMQFVRQRTLEGIEPVLSTVVMIGLAAAGMSYWSLIIGALVGRVAAGVVALATCPYPLRIRYERSTAGEYFSFSWPLFLQILAQLGAVQLAVIVGNWTVGLAGVGAIGLAGNFARFVMTLDTLINDTMYPAIVAVRDRIGTLYETFIKANRIGLMWGFPFGVGLFLFGPDLVHYVLGGDSKGWEKATPLLQAFGLILAVRQVAFNWTGYMQAIGRTKPIAVDAFETLIVFCLVTGPLMFALGLTGYVIGACVDVLCALVVRVYFIRQLFTGFSLLRQMWRGLAPTIPGAACVLALRLLEPDARTLGTAVGELILFALVTVAATWLLERRLIGEVIGYLRGRRGGPPVADSQQALPA